MLQLATYYHHIWNINHIISESPLPDANCNFEEGLCGWHNQVNDTFDWTLFRGETASIGTGPKVDHTTLTEEGFYLYIETSVPRELGDTATVQSHWLSVSGNDCKLSLYYHMEVGILSLIWQ